jgi:hypothetical protein
MARRALDLMKAVEHEIAGEKAFSLGRTGARLDRLLDVLRTLGERAAQAATAEERASCVAAFNACRARAADVYWALSVQREAMGVRRHDELAAMYPIPTKLV